MTHRFAPQLSAGIALVALACAPHPPPAFTPDPGVVAQIQQIRIIPREPRACPGAVIQADYEAILRDGTRVPFARAYDKKNPPRLHVRFLERQSPEAEARQNGDWVADPNPLATAATGFHLTATLRADSRITTTLLLPPTYDCMPRRLAFSGSGGIAGQSGQDGPDVTVRLEVQHSPFYEKLFVARIEVGGAKPSYVVGDSESIVRTGWLTIASSGGDGGNGSAGSDGSDGFPGSAGCPGQAGGQGQNGSDGGAGGDGGNGGRITIVVPSDRPELADLVRGFSRGGSGGRGGDGGRAGRGGKGGQGLFDANNQPCSNGADGSSGLGGSSGRSGFPGSSRPRAVVASNMQH